MLLREGLQDWMLMETIQDPTLPAMILQNLIEISEAEIFKKVEKGNFYYLRARSGVTYSAVFIKDGELHCLDAERPDDNDCVRFCEMVNEYYPDVIQWLLHKYDISKEIKNIKLKGLG